MGPLRHRRPMVGAALATAAVLVLPAGLAHAEPEDPLTVENLPSLPQEEVDSHRSSITIPDIEPITIPDIEPFEPEVTTDGADKVVSLDTDVLFEFGKAELSEEARTAVAEAVADVPDKAKVRVEGHTDSVGDDADNLTLSKKRAQAVADVLKKERSDLKLTVTGKGEKQPVAPNESGGKDNPEGREKNRRVEIRYQD